MYLRDSLSTIFWSVLITSEGLHTGWPHKTSKISKSFSSWPTVLRWRWRNPDLIGKLLMSDSTSNIHERQSCHLCHICCNTSCQWHHFWCCWCASLRLSCKWWWYTVIMSRFWFALMIFDVFLVWMLSMSWWANLIKVLLILAGLS